VPLTVGGRLKIPPLSMCLVSTLYVHLDKQRLLVGESKSSQISG
jgi:hypothetical protein